MSTSPDLTLKIKLDDRDLDAAIKKLQNSVKQIEIQLGGKLGGGGGAGGSQEEKSQKAKTGNYMTETLKSFKQMGEKLKEVSKSSLALVGIGTGIGALVAMMTEASPILQAMLKLISTSVLLILRPIGDFIGFILRPIIMLFMTKIALPFMLAMMPLAKKYGDKLGQLLVEFFQDPGATLTKIWEKGIPFLSRMFADVMKSLGVTGIPQLISSVLVGLVTDLIINPAKEAWKAISNFFNDLVIEPLQQAWAGLVAFFDNVGKAVDGVIESMKKSWENVVGFFAFIAEGVSGTLMQGWTNLLTWGNMVWAGVNSVLFKSWNSLISWIAFVSSTASGILTSAWEEFAAFFEKVRSTIVGVVSVAWNALVTVF